MEINLSDKQQSNYNNVIQCVYGTTGTFQTVSIKSVSLVKTVRLETIYNKGWNKLWADLGGQKRLEASLVRIRMPR